MARFLKNAVPATRSSAAVQRARRRVVILVLVAGMLSGWAGLSLSYIAYNRDIVIPQTVEPRLVAVAEQAGRDFLAGRNSSVPSAAGVSTDFSGEPTPVPADGETLTSEQVATILKGNSGLDVSSFALQGEQVTTVLGAQGGDQRVHLIRFRVVISSQPYLLSVPVIDHPQHGSLLGGTPALEPARAGKESAASANYAGVPGVTTSVTTEVEAAVERWAEAFAAGGRDSSELLSVTQDNTPGASYSGLGGWSAEVAQVTAAVPTTPGQGPGGWIVQAVVVLTPPGANSPPLTSTYDLYVVTEGHPNQHPVVAWDAAGSAADLTPYINAD